MFELIEISRDSSGITFGLKVIGSVPPADAGEIIITSFEGTFSFDSGWDRSDNISR